MFCCFTSDQECAAFSSTSCLAELGTCPYRQQGGLLQFSTRRHMSRHLHDRLQSVLNAAARLVFSARRNDHITPLLRDLHWLRIPERVKFRLCVLVYRCLHGMAPSYLADDLQLTSTAGTRRQLRSTDSPTLVVRSTRRSTLGDRAFPVAAARAWNSLPLAVRDAPSLLSFRSRLKTCLFELTLA